MSVIPISAVLPEQQHTHTVQFYGADGSLLHELNRYIGSALKDDCSAVVIATSGHLGTLSNNLKASGIDVARVSEEGRYIAADATETLSRFMVNGQPDPTRFSEVMGGVIARATGASRHRSHRVVAFGEMVALLWAEGRAESALKLEKLWNDLARTYSFALHCAYPIQGFARQDLADSLLKICREHTDVITSEVELDFKEQLGGQEHSFRSLVESLPDYAIFMQDCEGRVLTWNVGGERATGYSAEEIIGRNFSVFYPEGDVQEGRPQSSLHTAASVGRAVDDGWRVRKDGSQFWASMSIAPIKGANGKLMGFGNVMQDRTEQLRAELALRRSEERAHLFVECVRDYAIFMLDPEGYVSTWNTGAERIKGYKASEIIGQHFSRFYSEDDRRLGKPEWVLEVAKVQGHYEEDGWRVRKDGSRFWAHVVITAIRDHGEELLGFCKVTQDATERMLAQQKIEQSEASARELSLHLLRTQDEERRRIGREIHDSLGQYLAALKIKVDSLSSAPDLMQESGECAELLDACIKEVRTISYLLYPPMLEEVGLKSAIPWYLEGFSHRSGVKTTLQISDDLQRLPPDAELVLFRVLQESLTNVQRHSGSTTADVTVFDTSEAVTLQITDHGKGIPPAVLEQASQDWMGSLGVGLRGMSERLRQLGGSLQVSSGDEGTVVRAVVPLKPFREGDSIPRS